MQPEYLEPSAFFPAATSQAKHKSNAEESLDPSVCAYKLPSQKSRLEALIVADIDCRDSFNKCVTDHLKLLLRDNRTAAVKYMKECFDTLLEEPDFLAWLARKVDVKLNRLNNLIATNKYNRRSSHITTESYQEIYGFWISKSSALLQQTNTTGEAVI